MPTCEIGGCHGTAEAVVSHPYRPEDRTQVCGTHAERVVDEVGGDKVGSVG